MTQQTDQKLHKTTKKHVGLTYNATVRLSNLDLDLRPSQINIITPVTPAPGNVHNNDFGLRVKSRYVTDGRTDGQTESDRQDP